METVSSKRQHRDFNLAQSSRWNYLRDHTEQRNLLNRDIQLEDLTLCTQTNHGRVLLDHAKLTLLCGHRYGIVGRNGIGKTTLLQHIADHKIMGIYEHMRCIYVSDSSDTTDGATPPPETVKGARTVLQHLLSQHKERIAALQELHDVLQGGGGDDGDDDAGAAGEVDPDVLEAVVARLQLLSADAADSRARTVLLGLGLDPDTHLQALSGGWRQRATLATALFLEADVLLLDEPTNHLDIHAIIWLEAFLARTLSTVVVVSHDFEFLDHVATDMLEFTNSQSINAYTGNFSAYLGTKQLQVKQHKQAFKCQEIRRKRMEATIERLRVRASAASSSSGASGAYRMIHARQQQLKHRLGVSLSNVYWKYSLMGPRPELLAPLDAEPFEFEFRTDVGDVPAAGGKGEGETTLVALKDVGFSFTSLPAANAGGESGGESTGTSEKPLLLFQHVNITITLSTRLGLIGENGCGKTTLLRILADELQPTAGSCVRWCGLRVGCFHQDAIGTLFGDAAAASSSSPVSAIEWLHTRHPDKKRTAIVDALGGFGVLGLHAETTPIHVMSSGERARLLLSDLLLHQPHVLLLDEPTSYLDAETAAAIVAGLETFDGAVVVASHDRTFTAQVATELFCVDPWLFGPFPEDLEAYRDKVLLAHAKAKTTTVAPGGTRPSPPTKKALFKDPAAPKAQAVAPGTVGSASQEPLPQQAAAGPPPAAISCRHCKGDHFSHSCPDRLIRHPSDGQSLEKTERERAEALRLQLAEAAKPKPKPKLPPRTVVENNEVWQVAVSKSTKRRLAKGIS